MVIKFGKKSEHVPDALHITHTTQPNAIRIFELILLQIIAALEHV